MTRNGFFPKKTAHTFTDLNVSSESARTLALKCRTLPDDPQRNRSMKIAILDCSALAQCTRSVASARIVLLAMILMLLSACATVDDPIVYKKSDFQAQNSVEPKKILFLLDLGMLSDPFPSKSWLLSESKVFELQYGKIKKAIYEWGKNNSVEVEMKVHASKIPFEIDAANYSHIVSETVTGYDQVMTGSAIYIKNRFWIATVQEISDGQRPVIKNLYSERYLSDGIICFRPSALGNKKECQDNWLKLISSHFQRINGSWKVITPIQ